MCTLQLLLGMSCFWGAAAGAAGVEAGADAGALYGLAALPGTPTLPALPACMDGLYTHEVTYSGPCLTWHSKLPDIACTHA